MSSDSNLAVCREVAVFLRDVPYKKSKTILVNLLKAYDGKNRWYLEALGQAAKGKEETFYNELVKPKTKGVSDWSMGDALLAWRMQTQTSLNDLKQYITTNHLDLSHTGC